MIELICADALEWPLEYARECDVMLTDPPYSKHVHDSAVSQSKKRGARKRELGFEYLGRRLRQRTAAFAGQVKEWSVIYSDIESLGWLRISCLAAGAEYIRPIPWVRWSMPQLSGDRPTSGAEIISIFWGLRNGAKAWYGPGNLTHLKHLALRSEGKHKAEKPLDQALDLVAWFSLPGQLVFDPFAGAGTFGLACKLLGRNYIGLERDPTWQQKASERIDRGWDLSDRDGERMTRWLATVRLDNKYNADGERVQRQELCDQDRHLITGLSA